MAESVVNVDVLQQYIQGVVGRADHHAQNVDVDQIVLALAGAIVWKKDPDVDLKVLTQDGKMGNVLWVTIGGQRYAFSYNHQVMAVEVRRGSLKGETIAVFTNTNTVASIKEFFEQLG